MKLFTIGYSAYEREGFVEALRLHGVSLIVDVRSVPGSGYRPEYNREALGAYLVRHGIAYRHMPEAFGARQEKAVYLNKGNYVDFGLFSQSDAFLKGVGQIVEATEGGAVCALMCAEKDAINCHRAIMIGRRFYEKGWQVLHIMPDGVQGQDALEQRLLELYFPNRRQISMFEELRSDSELLDEAYRLQNQRIGFRKEE